MSTERLRSLQKVFKLTDILSQAARELEILWRLLLAKGHEKEGSEILHIANLIREADLCMLARDSIIEAAAAFLEGKIPEEQFEDIFNRWKAKMCDQCDGKRWILDEGQCRKPCQKCANGPVGQASTDPAFRSQDV